MSDLQTSTALMEPPGGAAPAPESEQQASTPPANPYGENNENLPEAQQNLLKGLALKFQDEDKFSRRIEIQTSKRAHWYWRTLQHIYWDVRAEGWVALGPNGAPLIDGGRGRADEDSAVLYTTNIYKPFGLTLIAVLTQSIPGVIAMPADAQDAADMMTAKAGNRIRKIIEHQNDATKLLTEAMFFAYVDGRSHFWTRNEKCPRTGKIKTLITVHGSLECKVPITARCEEEFLYIQYSHEQHVAIAKFENPKFKDKIRGGAAGSGEDVYERTARISVSQGTSYMSGSGDTLTNLSTVQQTWMLPAAFELLEKDAASADPEVDVLRKAFPNGCRLKLISGEYVGSWSEQFLDHWSVLNAEPGDGQFRNSMGHTEESVQERFNDIINIAQDTYEKCIPAGYADSEMLDVDGVSRQTSSPGRRYSVKKRPNEPIGENFFFEPPATVSPDMLQYGNQLMGDVSQFLTGAFPALFGGGEAKGAAGDTASGYAMQREQAMGRIGLVYRALKRVWAGVMGQAVKCTAQLKNDLSLSIPDEKGNVQTTQVRIEELQGDVHWFPESDEGLPRSWSEKRGTYMSLLPMADQNPLLAKILAAPRNQETGQNLIGLEDFEIPDACSWAKQMLEINELLKGAPEENPEFALLQQKHQQLTEMAKRGPVPDQELQALMHASQGVQQFNPTVPIDAECDNNPAEWQTVQDWLNDIEGQKAKIESPEGFQNVRLHGLLHKQAAMQQAMAMQPPPPPPRGAHGGPPPPSAHPPAPQTPGPPAP